MTAFDAPIDVVHIIQLSVAPVFLIAGIGALLNVMTQRLARVIDRSRRLEEMVRNEPQGEPRDEHVAELRALDQRMRRVNWAISLSTLAALLVCMVIMSLFASELVTFDLSRLVAVLFMATMLALIAALILFFLEISIAIRTLRVSREFRARNFWPFETRPQDGRSSGQAGPGRD